MGTAGGCLEGLALLAFPQSLAAQAMKQSAYMGGSPGHLRPCPHGHVTADAEAKYEKETNLGSEPACVVQGIP